MIKLQKEEVRGKVGLRKCVRLSKLATLKATDITPRREETV